jgi:hypothetical protein
VLADKEAFERLGDSDKEAPAETGAENAVMAGAPVLTDRCLPLEDEEEVDEVLRLKPRTLKLDCSPSLARGSSPPCRFLPKKLCMLFRCELDELFEDVRRVR